MRKIILSFMIFAAMLQNAFADIPTNPEVEKSINYVISLDPVCSYGDAYVCEDVAEEDLLFPTPSTHMIPGIYLPAWEVSYADFKRITDLSEEQKNLMHYKIGFTESKTHFIILFNALLLPQLEQGRPISIMNVTLGRSTKYWIDRNTFEISDRKFLK